MNTPPRFPSWTDGQLAHLVLRLTLGVNIATHGLVRAGSAGAFADALVRDFEKTLLPAWTVRPFALALPFLELVVGACILLGLGLRVALVAGGLLMAALTFGMALRQMWEVVGLQLVYTIAYSILLARLADARLTVDGRLGRARRAAAGA